LHFHVLQLLLYKSEINALQLKPDDLHTFDALAFWASKMQSALRPLAIQAIRVLTIPRSGSVIESTFSLVQHIQANKRVRLGAQQVESELMIKMNGHMINY